MQNAEAKYVATNILYSHSATWIIYFDCLPVKEDTIFLQPGSLHGQVSLTSLLQERQVTLCFLSDHPVLNLSG